MPMSMPMGMPMMKMYFHFRENEFILFHGWMPRTSAAYFFSLLAIFALSLLYEAIRVGRALLYRMEEAANNNNSNDQQHQCCSVEREDAANEQPISSYQQETGTGTGANPSSSQSGGCDCLPAQRVYQAPQISSFPPSPSALLSPVHLFQSLLHFFQFFLGFSLMLLAMTYNVPIFVALLLGHSAGYFLAGPLYQHGLAEEGRIGGECCCS